MKKFVIHTKWIEYFRNLLDAIGSDEDASYDTLATAFILFEQIAHYAESGEYYFNDTQYRAKAMFLSLKPQIDADLKAFKKSRGAMIADALKENERVNGLNS